MATVDASVLRWVQRKPPLTIRGRHGTNGGIVRVPSAFNGVGDTFDAFHDTIGGGAIWELLNRLFIPAPAAPSLRRGLGAHLTLFGDTPACTPEQPFPTTDYNYCVPVRPSVLQLRPVMPLAQTRLMIASDASLRPPSTLWKAKRN
ncbi:hypothetical protein EV122DRAFT_274631 [Schizophyllum commune]